GRGRGPRAVRPPGHPRRDRALHDLAPRQARRRERGAVRLAARMAPPRRAVSAPEAGVPLPPPARVSLAPGRLFVSATPAQVSTILGSCVSVCLWDPEARAGGINHFLLPEGVPASPRFGQSAVPLLIQGVLDLGARRTRLRAKVFG